MRHIGSISAIAAICVTATTAHADLSISSKPTQNMSCNAGVCTPTAPKAVLNVGDLQTMLASGDLTVQTGNGNHTAAGFLITDSIGWKSASRLTLIAKHNIVLNARINVYGNGALTITYAVGNPAGDLLILNRGKINFRRVASTLVVNGTTFELVGDLKTLAEKLKANPSGAFAFANDYDAAVDGTYGRAPITTTLSGTVLGLGHIVSNLAVTASYSGLFQEIGSGGLVRDLTVQDVNIGPKKGKRFVGAIAAVNDGTVLNVHSSGSVGLDADTQTAGGLVGLNTGTIENSSSTAQISASINSYVGGLVGQNTGTIAHSASTGSVHGGGIDTVYVCLASAVAGGLVGYNQGRVIQSNATGNVEEGSGDDNECERVSFAGGLVGFGGSIDQSYSTGSVSPGTYLAVGGGLAGAAGVITNSYARGNVTNAADDLGGLVGDFVSGSLQGLYSTGQVYMVSGNCGTGGLIGCDDNGAGPVSSAFWDLDTSGVTNPSQGCGYPVSCAGVTGLSDAQLKAGLPAGFDPKIWAQSPKINNGYPYLLANPPR